MLVVTSVSAAALTALYLKLTLEVIRLRRKNRVGLGSGGHDDLERAIRAHGNFAEYVPLGLILMGCLELNGAPWWLVAAHGLTLTIGRLLYTKGINTPPPQFKQRVLGMQFTFYTLASLAVLNLVWALSNVLRAG